MDFTYNNLSFICSQKVLEKNDAGDHFRVNFANCFHSVFIKVTYPFVSVSFTLNDVQCW